MQINNLSNINTPTKALAFKGQKSQEKGNEYIDRLAVRRAGTAGLLGNIAGSMIIGMPVVHKILNGPITKEVVKVAGPAKAIAAVATMFLSTTIPAYLATKFWVNNNRSTEDKLSNKSIAKLTAGSVVGLAIGSKIGNGLQRMMASNGVLPMLANAIIAVIGNDTGVNMIAKTNNKNAAQNAPSNQFQTMTRIPSSSEQFEYFLLKTQK